MNESTLKTYRILQIEGRGAGGNIHYPKNRRKWRDVDSEFCPDICFVHYNSSFDLKDSFTGVYVSMYLLCHGIKDLDV